MPLKNRHAEVLHLPPRFTPTQFATVRRSKLVCHVTVVCFPARSKVLVLAVASPSRRRQCKALRGRPTAPTGPPRVLGGLLVETRRCAPVLLLLRTSRAVAVAVVHADSKWHAQASANTRARRSWALVLVCHVAGVCFPARSKVRKIAVASPIVHCQCKARRGRPTAPRSVPQSGLLVETRR